MRRSLLLESDNDDRTLYAEFWRRDDLWTRVKSRVAPGIVVVGVVSGIAWIVRSLA
jgi:2-phosphoglycerate kinase